ncbi:phage tail protein [Erythrobacter sp. 3-20A1M]|uniref:phage tail protein n=1 Tax=Erythrobacter sp. 3-20A1M TaxID=2653850 RepID=UPI001BFCD50A|nr:phage tail protein [Erythrobacter sp. 3-20A1M]
MATLVLSTVGTLVGGPVGGLLGAAIGRQLDGSVFGAPAREGPRLRELALTTSTYGTPIARIHGTMRVPGSVIWASQLHESRSSAGGGKGQPSTTSYSYSASFAVAVCSRPITAIGRIWADGALLRGAAGDLKTGGQLRVHRGFADQPPDPLIAAAIGADCPAFRDTAYLVFEDLPLADFGNRLPALTFEVMAAPASVSLGAIAAGSPQASGESELVGLTGLAVDGGTPRDMLAMLGRLYPVDIAGFARKAILRAPATGDEPHLPEALEVLSQGTAHAGAEWVRETDPASPLRAIRYYDPALDFQPGIQRAEGRATGDGERSFDCPVALPAAEARRLLQDAARRQGTSRRRVSWRLAALDARFAPGALVRVPGHAGLWRVTAWEWRDSAVELELALESGAGVPAMDGATDAGSPVLPRDRAPGALRFSLVDLPWDGRGDASGPPLYAVLSGEHPEDGAALFAHRGDELVPVVDFARAAAVEGRLAEPLPPSRAVRFEQAASMLVDLSFAHMRLTPTTMEGLVAGANRLLVGDEIVQFLDAEAVGETRWRLTGLLRGRGGTEPMAQVGHAAETSAILIDEALLPLPGAPAMSLAGTRMTAIGRGTSEPIEADVRKPGAGVRPLAPVHTRRSTESDGAVTFSWTRRARGAWLWRDAVDAPLVEERELYRLGIGDLAYPVRSWTASRGEYRFAADEMHALEVAFPSETLWVQQVGSFSAGPPTSLAIL